jgi:hypothetical protein
MLLMLLLGLGCKSKLLSLEIISDIYRLLFAVLIWYLAFVAVPRWKGYRVEEEVEVLSDGTSIGKLIHVMNEVDE